MVFHKTPEQRTGIQNVFQRIKENGPLSKRELQELTGFSWGMISQTTNHLAEQGYIVASEDKQTGSVGRKAEKFGVVSTDFFTVGVDIDSREVLVVVVDMKGRLVESVHCDWERTEKDAVLDQLYALLDGIMDRYADKRILGIGFSVQGIADVENGVSVYIRKINDWNNVPLRSLFSRRYGLDVVVAHDPDCLMECERCIGALQGSTTRNVLMVHYTHGLGIGLSIMINGGLYLGQNGRAGELGYFILGRRPDGEADLLQTHISAAKSHEENAKFWEQIGDSVAVVNSLLDPETIVVHTVGCADEENLFRSIEQAVRTSSYNPEVCLLHSKLRRDAKATGAAFIAINRAIDDLL